MPLRNTLGQAAGTGPLASTNLMTTDVDEFLAQLVPGER